MKGSRKLLVSSFIMILSCCLLFVGATFAWFSDSVSTNNNIITAGTLKVGLEYSTDNSAWINVDETTSIFSADDLWAPGTTKVVYFKVSNKGTLDLNYTFNLNVLLEKESVNVNGDKFKLSDYLCYGVGEGLSANVDSVNKKLATTDHNTLADNVELEANGVDYLWLVVTMPKVGNAANTKDGYAAPSVQLGFDLLASQNGLTDSIGEVSKPVANVTELAAAPTLSSADLTGRIGSNSTEAVELETAYSFKAVDSAEEAKKSEYMNWHADFVVSFNAPVNFGDFTLAGQYDKHSTQWVAIDYTEELVNSFLGTDANVLANKGSELRLLETTGFHITYDYLCSGVKEFKCGVVDTDNRLDSVTMTVQLVLFETELNGNQYVEVEGGKRLVLQEIDYTFGDGSYAELSNVNEITAPTLSFDGVDATAVRYGSNSTEAIELDSAYSFTSVETSEAAKNSEFANWHADFVVSFNAPVNFGDFTLAGQYNWHSENWVVIDYTEELTEIFDLDGNVLGNAGSELRLLESAGYHITYDYLCSKVKEFQCGIAASDALNGVTITVQLVLFETELNGNQYTEVAGGRRVILQEVTYVIGK